MAKNVLMLATDGFAELVESRARLIAGGATVQLASLDTQPISGLEWDAVGQLMSQTSVTPDLAIADVELAAFDALVLPGGLRNPDTLRMDPGAVAIVRAFVAQGKVVAAICHGPWLLVEADVLKGRRATSWSSIRTDLRNAGATVVDEPVVMDGHVITSRMPQDIPVFVDAVLAAL
jgi:protease I